MTEEAIMELGKMNELSIMVMFTPMILVVVLGVIYAVVRRVD